MTVEENQSKLVGLDTFWTGCHPIDDVTISSRTCPPETQPTKPLNRIWSKIYVLCHNLSTFGLDKLPVDCRFGVWLVVVPVLPTIPIERAKCETKVNTQHVRTCEIYCTPKYFRRHLVVVDIEGALTSRVRVWIPFLGSKCRSHNLLCILQNASNLNVSSA